MSHYEYTKHSTHALWRAHIFYPSSKVRLVPPFIIEKRSCFCSRLLYLGYV